MIMSPFIILSLWYLSGLIIWFLVFWFVIKEDLTVLSVITGIITACFGPVILLGFIIGKILAFLMCNGDKVLIKRK